MYEVVFICVLSRRKRREKNLRYLVENPPGGNGLNWIVVFSMPSLYYYVFASALKWCVYESISIHLYIVLVFTLEVFSFLFLYVFSLVFFLLLANSQSCALYSCHTHPYCTQWILIFNTKSEFFAKMIYQQIGFDTQPVCQKRVYVHAIDFDSVQLVRCIRVVFITVPDMFCGTLARIQLDTHEFVQNAQRNRYDR